MNFVLIDEQQAHELRMQVQSRRGVWEEVAFGLKQWGEQSLEKGPWSVTFSERHAISGDPHESRRLPVGKRAHKRSIIHAKDACKVKPRGIRAGRACLHQTKQVNLGVSFRRLGHIFKQKHVADRRHIHERFPF